MPSTAQGEGCRLPSQPPDPQTARHQSDPEQQLRAAKGSFQLLGSPQRQGPESIPPPPVAVSWDVIELVILEDFLGNSQLAT